MNPINVFLFGGEGTGWALDADVATTKKSLEAIPELVRLTPLEEAQVVHSVWEYPLLHMNPKLLDGKRIICHVCNDLMRTFEDPIMVAAGETLGMWVAISKTAQVELLSLGFKTTYIPYSVNTSTFKPFNQQVRQEFRDKHKLPEKKFVISSFMRDSAGGDLSRPKEQKGVEAFVAIACELKRRNVPIHYLLAGPRRHWLRKKLSENDIPFTYIGKVLAADDNTVNILSPEKINVLYQCSDLHLVTSRWEGGPRAVLEAAANKTPILCTSVGLAPDILDSEYIISDVGEAVDKIEHFANNGLEEYPVQEHFDTVTHSFTPRANVDRFRKLYEEIENVPVFVNSSIKWERSKKNVVPVQRSIYQRILEKIESIMGKHESAKLTIGLWHEYHKPPYGGGNQFMLALRKELERMNVRVVVNKVRPDVDVYICNSAWFDTIAFEEKLYDKPLRVIHRIDGPTTLYRGEGSAEDDKIFNLNHRFASATAFQSAYSLVKSSELGYSPVSPIVIHNAVDGDIFHNRGRVGYDHTDKISLISTAWSDNPRKGGPFYKWLDENLDFNRFEYTFVGRVKQEFGNIKHIAPQGSERLAEILRGHHIYIAASKHEPCSNALIEALACGLPALYRNDGGNSELVQFGGLPFDGKDDFFEKLNRLVENYTSFQSAIFVKSMNEVAKGYYELAEKIVQYHRDQ